MCVLINYEKYLIVFLLPKNVSPVIDCKQRNYEKCVAVLFHIGLPIVWRHRNFWNKDNEDYCIQDSGTKTTKIIASKSAVRKRE